MSGDRINQALPSFINGVSQQPPTVRLATQYEALQNGLPSVSDGLRKRPPSVHMAKLWDGRMDDCFSYAINRDRFEKYMLFIAGGTLKVVDLLDGGAEKTVAFPDGTSYLQADLPRSAFAAVTVADYTFIVNKAVAVAMTEELTPEAASEALVYVKNGYVETTYTITVNGQSAAHTTGPSTVQPNTINIATKLKEVLVDKGFVVDQVGSVLRIKMADGSDFTFSVTDSWGENAMVGIKKKVAKFTDLPAKAFDGFTVQVTGESRGENDDYYVRYTTDGGTRNGTWDEVRGWGLPTSFDTSTMPHVLVREADGTFTFREGEWEAAEVGDDESCPPPSFIGKTINSMFFFQNRLGVLSGENVVMSRDAEYFNFWPKTATTLLATDPIDFASATEKVSVLRHAVPFQNALSLFSDQVQFQLGNGGAAAFGPEQVRLDVTTQYDCSEECVPVAAGQNVYFISENRDNSALMEYFVTSDGVTLDAVDVTAHVPRYVPHGVYKMIASTNDDYIMLIAADERNVVWLYKFFWINEEKVQSAWGRWTFPEDDAILSIANAGEDVYIVFQRDDGVYLETLNMHSVKPDPDMTFQALLDRKAEVQGVYDDLAKTTSFTLPYPVVDPSKFRIVLGGAFAYRAGREFEPVIADGITATIPGKWDAGVCYAGNQYEFRLRLSEQFVREGRDIGSPVIAEGRLQLLSFRILHRNSGYFYSEVTAKGREAVVKKHLGTIGDNRFRIGLPVLDSEPHEFFVMSRSSQVIIDIVNDKHYPSNLLSGEWVGLYTFDARRI